MTKPRLLLVDDDKDTLDGLTSILKRDGYQVAGVLSGYEALNSLSKKSFDVVITDLNMPGMHGLTLIHEVRKRKKPVNIEELKSILEKLWEKQRVLLLKKRNKLRLGVLVRMNNI